MKTCHQIKSRYFLKSKTVSQQSFPKTLDYNPSLSKPFLGQQGKNNINIYKQTLAYRSHF